MQKQRSKKKESLILERLDVIEAHLKKFKSKPLNAVQAAEYLSISLQHLYRLTSQRKIPFHKPSNRYIYFFEHELNEWIAGDCQTEDCKTKDGKISRCASLTRNDDEMENEENEELEPP